MGVRAQLLHPPASKAPAQKLSENLRRKGERWCMEHCWLLIKTICRTTDNSRKRSRPWSAESKPSSPSVYGGAVEVMIRSIAVFAPHLGSSSALDWHSSVRQRQCSRHRLAGTAAESPPPPPIEGTLPERGRSGDGSVGS
ncbi:uncharacterized protein VSU04_012736 [Chlamydotis macqueenii]